MKASIVLLLPLVLFATAALGLKSLCPRGAECNGLHYARSGPSDTVRVDAAEPPYPWWTGVELANPLAKIQFEFFGSFTCPDCRSHWEQIVKPILAKYKQHISFVHQPFALVYQSYSMDATQAAFAVYRLTHNNVSAWMKYSESIFTNQDIFFNTFDMTQRQVWTQYFAAWAAPLGISQSQLFNAMNGTTTSANDDAWYSARFARQRTLPGAPTFIINKWLPWDLPLASWKFSDWDAWIQKALKFV